MTSSDSVIERWLEQNQFDHENLPNNEGSDVDLDNGIQHVLQDSCESNSEGE